MTLVAAVMMMMAYSTSAVAAGEKEVPIGINAVFVPGSFDSTADAYVVVSGIFQNGCYKWGRAEMVSRDAFNHEISPTAIVTPGMCIMVLIPFQKEVRLGKLQTGTHNLRFLSGDGTYLDKTLVIE